MQFRLIANALTSNGLSERVLWANARGTQSGLSVETCTIRLFFYSLFVSAPSIRVAWLVSSRFYQKQTSSKWFDRRLERTERKNEPLTLHIKDDDFSLSSKSIRCGALVISAVVTWHAWQTQVGVTGSILFKVSVWSDPGHPRGRVALHFTLQQCILTLLDCHVFTMKYFGGDWKKA